MSLLYVAIGVVVLIALWFVFGSKTQKPKKIEPTAAPPDPPTTVPTVVMYYGEKCPHCVTFKPVWNEYKTKAKILTKEYEAGVHRNVLIANKITGVPTIRFYPIGTADPTTFTDCPSQTLSALLETESKILS